MLPRYIKLLLATIVIVYTSMFINLITWISSQQERSISQRGKHHHFLDSNDVQRILEAPPRNLRHYLQIHHKRNHSPEKISKERSVIKTSEYTSSTFQTIQNITIFSAYYDRRGVSPVLRVIVAAPIGSKEKLLCGYESGTKGPWFMPTVYEMCENHGKQYGGFIYTCNIPKKFQNAPGKVFLRSLTSLSGKQVEEGGKFVSLDIKVIKHSPNTQQEFSQITNDTPHELCGIHVQKNKTEPSADPDPPDILHTDGTTSDNIPWQQTAEQSRMKNDSEHFQILAVPTASKQNDTSITNSRRMKTAVCVPPLYGKIDLSKLIQFIELAKIQGVSHFTFYKTTVASNVEQLLKYYVKKGYITLVDWQLPPHLHGDKLWYHGQLPSIQDCLYRNMEIYDYLAFIDLDELIIPRYHFSWQEMLQYLETEAINDHGSSPVSGFSFQSGFFNPHQQLDPTHQLSFLQTLMRNEVLSTIRRKLIVKPNHVFEMGIHHVSKTICVNQTVTSLDVDPVTAIVNHYQRCNNNFDTRMVCEEPIKDNTVLKYKDQLLENYKRVLRENIHKLK